MWKTVSLLFLVLHATSALYTKKDKIVELTESNFDALVTTSDEFWLVQFYSPHCGHCRRVVPEYQKVAKILNGIIKIGAVDLNAHNNLGTRFGIKGFPTIMIFGANKRKPVEYHDERTAKVMAEAIQDEFKTTINGRLYPGAKSRNGKKSNGGKGKVIELTDKNFERLVLNSNESWMVSFYAPWCGHCKRLKPDWEKAAENMAGEVKFGAMDATVHETIPSRFSINGFPTIKFFPPGSGFDDAVSFDGDRSAQYLQKFAAEKAASLAPPPKLSEVTGRNVVEEACNGKQLCVFAFLPNILDCQSKCRYAHIDMLNSLALSFKTRKWGWVWVEGGSQPDIENSFSIGGFGYPALAVLSPQKMKYSTLKGSFEEASIKEFLNGVGFGKSTVLSVNKNGLGQDGFLKVATIAGWNGKDGEIPKVEELDLSDVDLEKNEL